MDDADKPLATEQVKAVLERLEQAADREACWSCERLQKFIAQLDIDAAEAARSLLEMYQVRPEKLHGGLGCQPCPPAEVFIEYIKSRNQA